MKRCGTLEQLDVVHRFLAFTLLEYAHEIHFFRDDVAKNLASVDFEVSIWRFLEHIKNGHCGNISLLLLMFCHTESNIANIS